MALELRHVRYFLMIAQEGNMTRAAELLGIQQPPLSQQVKDLEREVGARLFHRLPRGVELTEAGQAFLLHVKPLIPQLERACREARYAARGERGELRIGFTGAAGINAEVQRAIRVYQRAYPHVRLSLTETNTSTLLKQLAEHEMDAVYVRPTSEHLQMFQVLSVSEEQMVAVVPADHRSATRKVIELSELQNDPFVITPQDVGLAYYDTIMEACQRAGFQPIIGQIAPQLLSVVSLVAAGLGVSVVPATMRHVQLEGCTYLDLGPSGPTIRFSLALRRLERSAVVRRFAEIATGA